jgi:hypothetical protein
VERFRKDAKSLLKAYRAGQPEAVARAEAVLGARARSRFQLSDAQHVIAHEQGRHSWADLGRRADMGEGATLEELRGRERGEIVLEPGPTYREGEPVRVRVRKRGHWLDFDDGGAAVTLAGTPPGWLDVAERAVIEAGGMNVNRRGVVFVGVHERRDLASIAERLAEASLAVYVALLELGD